MTSLFVCGEHKLYKKKFTSVINEQVFVTNAGIFVPKTIRSLEHSFPGLFVPWNFRSRNRSFPGPFVPETEYYAENSFP